MLAPTSVCTRSVLATNSVPNWRLVGRRQSNPGKMGNARETSSNASNMNSTSTASGIKLTRRAQPTKSRKRKGPTKPDNLRELGELLTDVLESTTTWEHVYAWVEHQDEWRRADRLMAAVATIVYHMRMGEGGLSLSDVSYVVGWDRNLLRRRSDTLRLMIIIADLITQALKGGPDWAFTKRWTECLAWDEICATNALHEELRDRGVPLPEDRFYAHELAEHEPWFVGPETVNRTISAEDV